MGTSNFNNNRSNNIYSILDNEDDFIYEDTRSNIRYTLEKYDKDNYNIDFVYDEDVNLNEVLRSYPATSIGTLYSNFYYMGLDIDINIIPKTVSGYYEGFNLDYEIELYHDGISYDNIEDLLNDFIEYNPTLRGLFKIHQRRLIKMLSNDLYFLIDIIEHVFKMYSYPLEVIARFSNGETIYQRLDNGSF